MNPKEHHVKLQNNIHIFNNNYHIIYDIFKRYIKYLEYILIELYNLTWVNVSVWMVHTYNIN